MHPTKQRPQLPEAEIQRRLSRLYDLALAAAERREAREQTQRKAA